MKMLGLFTGLALSGAGTILFYTAFGISWKWSVFSILWGFVSGVLGIHLTKD